MTDTNPATVPEEKAEALRRLSEAVEMHQRGGHAEALATYSQLLQGWPRDPTILHFAGMAHAQLDHFVESEAALTQALEINPEYHDAWNSLGNLYRLSGRPQEALAAYQRATELAPESVSAWVNLGDACRHTRNVPGARRALSRAIELVEKTGSVPEGSRAAMLGGLAAVSQMDGNWTEALRLYRLALDLNPDDAPCRRDFIGALAASGQKERALALADEWLARQPDHVLARRVHASLTGINTPSRIADDEITTIFDEFASTFDKQLRVLMYRAPALLEQAVAGILGPPGGSLDVCDAGCGTGLCGVWLKPFARRLTGVDLSKGMLDLADERGLYDVLERAELTEWLQRSAGAFDLLVCADTLCYFGSLSGYGAAAFSALRPGGLAAFTVEYREEPCETGYFLQMNGRYTHTRDYVRGCLSEAGFEEIRAELCDLRLERGRPVRGLVVSARRP